MINWEGYRRKQWPNLRYYPSICLEGLRGTMQNWIFVNYFALHYFMRNIA
jgi:hypothetical protein